MIKRILLIFAISFLGILFNYKYINEFPSYAHAWAQSDHYAIALGFVKNNLNFFRPQTFVMNKLDKEDRKVPTNNTITAVDFPINDYLPAVIMKICGTNAVWIFRTYTLLYSFIGLYFLFRLAGLITNNSLKALLVVLFAATSPVFVYYQAGFLPTIPCLADSIIGLFFYSRYLKGNSRTDFNLGIVFLTLATLSRTTCAINLLAVCGLEISRVWRKQLRLKPIVIPMITSLIIIGSFHLYNNYLREVYGSDFLNHFLPARSYNEAKKIFSNIYKNWIDQYFSYLHYLVLFVSIAAGAFYFFRKRTPKDVGTNDFYLLVVMLIMGNLAFGLLMFRQFVEHDYYFLDTFFLPVLFILVITLSWIAPSNNKNVKVYGIGIALLSIPLIATAIRSQSQRRNTGYWDRIAATINNFRNSDLFLDSLKIPGDAKMLVLDAYAPNIPFIFMNRKGFAVLNTSQEEIQEALKWNYDYLIIQDDFFLSDVYNSYPDIIKKIKIFSDNGKISICMRLKKDTIQSLYEFLGLEKKIPVFERTMTFDSVSVADTHWHNVQMTSGRSPAGNRCGYLDENMTYGLTYKTKDLKSIMDKSRVLLCSAFFRKDTLRDCEVVVSFEANGNNIYYKSYNIKDMIKKKNEWEKVDLLFNIPPIGCEECEFGIFIWNTGKNNLCLGDFSFKIY